ncbi:aldehyde dehydrogenase family protein [Streptomyces montanisoli]|uniref:Aldehyde dehydrogenase family protein n=1 Tax=Streptomyces montanisoli TaxID=2798581 RepID=A0A940MDV4_9ACTN|nr:aldehyde dehydrogenase family protein [Streptomyces montanisoli]MBP0458180.1 aldehyde dehydrogenase family protein [Streptomyces montanisoli]
MPSVISFTGSTEVGRHIAEVAGRNLKKPILELGGNSALIVLADADLDLAVDAAVFSRFTHQGQICMSANRVLVHRDVYPRFARSYVSKVRSLRVGDPRDDGTVLGPLINRRQSEALDRLVRQGIEEGALPLLRGRVNGTLFEPVVLGDVTTDMAVAQAELFGPVVCLMPFDTEEQAVAMANDTPFGLSGAVHTRDLDHGAELAKRLDTGMVHVNDTSIDDQPLVAFGGEKNSGYGRLNGEWSLHEFTTHQWISINRGRRRYPY